LKLKRIPLRINFKFVSFNQFYKLIKNENLQSFSAFVFIILVVFSCIEPFEANFKVKDSIIVVDGNFTDNTEGNYVSIRKSVPSGKATSSFFDIKDAKVELLVDDNVIVSLTHRIEGIYDFPKGLKAESGHTYKLKFTLSDGTVYSSLEQKINKVTPIISIKQQFASEIDLQGSKVPGHKIYLSTNEPEGKGDAYYWSYRLFEVQNYCLTCFGSVLKKNPDGTAFCEYNAAAATAQAVFDYECDKKCWRIFYSEDLNAMNDAFVDGQGIVDRFIADIPYYNKKGALLEVSQHAVDDQAYKYIKLLIDQNQNSGSLADTPSTALNGNIKSDSNPEESVGGYFLVSSVSTVNYNLKRADVPSNIQPIGYVVGRARVPGPGTPAPPQGPCVNNRFMTPNQPENWISE
jgi:hypothetical protein